MGKKRKSDATRLDEVDRNMYSTFCTAASSLSQLYTQTMHQQRLSFQAGERHALEKLYNWIVRQQEDGVRVMTSDILTYMQFLDVVLDEKLCSSTEIYERIRFCLKTGRHYEKAEMTTIFHLLMDLCVKEALISFGKHLSGKNESEYGTEEPSSSPRLPLQQQHPSQSALHSAHSGLPVSFGAATVGQGLRSGNSDQTKNNVFSSALSSPVRRSLQHYHLTQGGYNANNSVRTNDNGGNQTRDPNPLSSNDTSMDMHADSPDHDSPY